MTTYTDHVGEILHNENMQLKEDLETAQWSYGHLVEAIEEHLGEYIFDDDVAAPVIYHDAIVRAATHIPEWTFLKGGKFPDDGQIVIAAYIDDSDGDAKSVEAKWQDGEWYTEYSCLDISESVYAWTFLLTPPRPLDE